MINATINGKPLVNVGTANEAGKASASIRKLDPSLKEQEAIDLLKGNGRSDVLIRSDSGELYVLTTDAGALQTWRGQEPAAKDLFVPAWPKKDAEVSAGPYSGKVIYADQEAYQGIIKNALAVPAMLSFLSGFIFIIPLTIANGLGAGGAGPLWAIGAMAFGLKFMPTAPSPSAPERAEALLAKSTGVAEVAPTVIEEKKA